MSRKAEVFTGFDKHIIMCYTEYKPVVIQKFFSEDFCLTIILVA